MRLHAISDVDQLVVVSVVGLRSHNINLLSLHDAHAQLLLAVAGAQSSGGEDDAKESHGFSPLWHSSGLKPIDTKANQDGVCP